MSWWYSLLFVVPVVILVSMGIANLLGGGSEPGRIVAVRVTDATTQAPVAGAVVSVNGKEVSTTDKGDAKVEVTGSSVVTITRDGYEPVYGQIDLDSAAKQTASLRPNTISGRLVDEITGNPIAGALVSVVAPDGSSPSTASTMKDGSYILKDVPQGATILVDAGDNGTWEGEAPSTGPLDVALKVVILTGIVTDKKGNALSGATVSAGPAATTTDEDGAFRLANAPESGSLEVSMPGYKEVTADIVVGERSEFVLTRQTVKAIYLNPDAVTDPEHFQQMLDLIESTEINAVVLDIKEEYVFYDTGVQFFHDAEAVSPLYDPAKVVAQFKDMGVYTIARMVVFKDPIIADHRKDLAIVDLVTGEVWRDYNGIAWVNPRFEEVQQANIELAVEAANMGFDEIQYDYIRFPTDGDLNTADFGFDYSDQSARVEIIASFLKESQAALRPTGAKFAVDVFGIVAVYDDDQGIGQRLRDIQQYVDYLCPMVYPSHFDASSIDVGGEPDELPYETVLLSMQLAADKVDNPSLKLRPWLQDFTIGMVYGPDEVRAQIQASDDANTNGWMIWNAGSVYTDAAFAPED